MKIDNWDLRFLSLAKLVSTWSKDPSSRVGSCIIRQDKSIVSAGFNGFSQKALDKKEMYENREIKLSKIVHAEINAYIFAHEVVKGYTMYVYPFGPCDRCTNQMIQAGIERFVFPEPSQDALTRWGDSFNKSKQYMIEANVDFLEVPLEYIL